MKQKIQSDTYQNLNPSQNYFENKKIENKIVSTIDSFVENELQNFMQQVYKDIIGKKNPTLEDGLKYAMKNSNFYLPLYDVETGEKIKDFN